jgi:mono/diheme cytochrome c family protein
VTRRPKRLAALAPVLLVALAASGCGDKETDKANGKALFVQKCGSCHTLAHATEAKGEVGPNLDAAFAQSRKNGEGENTFAGVVRDQIAHPRVNSVMPAKLVTGQNARDVADYVASVAGVPGKDKGLLATAGAPKTSGKPILAKGGKLEIDANPTGATAFASTKAESPAGAVEVAMLNPSGIDHDIAVEDKSGKELGKGAIVGKGKTSQFNVKLTPGTYTFLCTVPGHAEGGMKGTLTVK